MAEPASRTTRAEYGDIRICLGEKARGNTVTLTLGDGALASADSSGSTETQTATPTLDIKTKIDARYNDALAAASTASKGVLSSIGAGLDGVLSLMANRQTGVVPVTKADGTKAAVKCADGQCEFCEDCEFTEGK